MEGKGGKGREGKGKGEREGGSLYNWKPPPPDEILATPLLIKGLCR